MGLGVEPVKPEVLAAMFHNLYESLAPKFGYESRFKNVEFDDLPENNRKLMIAVCRVIMDNVNMEYKSVNE